MLRLINKRNLGPIKREYWDENSRDILIYKEEALRKETNVGLRVEMGDIWNSKAPAIRI